MQLNPFMFPADMLDELYQSKSSILKKGGASSNSKKVRFDTTKARSEKSSSGWDVCTDMATKPWSPSNSSKKKVCVSAEDPHCSKDVTGAGVASLPPADEFEVEAILDHKKVGM